MKELLMCIIFFMAIKYLGILNVMWNKYHLYIKFHCTFSSLFNFIKANYEWYMKRFYVLIGRKSVWYGFLGNSTSKCIHYIVLRFTSLLQSVLNSGRCFLQNSVQIQILMKSNVVILCPTIKSSQSPNLYRFMKIYFDYQ